MTPDEANQILKAGEISLDTYTLEVSQPLTIADVASREPVIPVSILVIITQFWLNFTTSSIHSNILHLIALNYTQTIASFASFHPIQNRNLWSHLKLTQLVYKTLQGY